MSFFEFIEKQTCYSKVIKKDDQLLPKASEQAFWIYPNNEIHQIRKSETHIMYLIEHCADFDVSETDIERLYRRYDELVGVEQQARNELILDVLKRDFMTVRFLADQKGGWIIRVWDFQNDQNRKRINTFLEYLSDNDFRTVSDDSLFLIKDFKNEQNV